MLNSKRCFKASTQNCKIEALKLVGEVRVNFQNFALAPCRTLFITGSFQTRRVSFYLAYIKRAAIPSRLPQ
ncbi:hypothetical protein DWQ65_01000 [Treponema phagedenis]|nr:hypothetical protein DWQ65_01000 [Treponema phagedenis]